MEFPPSDPVPSNFAPPAYASQAVVPPFNHPPYQEMIRRAIVALNEKDGSSKQAISRYIENVFRLAPSPTHSRELTHQLKTMKMNGQLVLVKHSYTIPGIINPPQAQTQAQASGGSKRRPGRPSKLQATGGPIVSSSPAAPVGFAAFRVPTTNLFGGLTSGALQFGGGGHFSNAPTIGAPPVSNAQTMGPNSGSVTKSVMVGVEQPESVGPSVVSAGPQNNDGLPLAVVPPPTMLGKRGRGRPPKLNMMGNPGQKIGRSGPTVYFGTGRRGRPRKLAVSTTIRPRGKPRKYGVGATVAFHGAGGEALPVAKKPSGKPLGRPTKNVSDTATLMSEMQLMAYQGLKAKIEHYQARIKRAVSVVKPYLNETAVIALGALQDLEELANMDIASVPVHVQSAPVHDLNPPVNVQNAPVIDLNATVNVQDAAQR